MGVGFYYNWKLTLVILSFTPVLGAGAGWFKVSVTPLTTGSDVCHGGIWGKALQIPCVTCHLFRYRCGCRAPLKSTRR